MNDHQVPLIEDGLYAEIQFGGALSPAVKAFDRDGWVLFCSSFTKRWRRIFASAGSAAAASTRRCAS